MHVVQRDALQQPLVLAQFTLLPSVQRASIVVQQLVCSTPIYNLCTRSVIDIKAGFDSGPA